MGKSVLFLLPPPPLVNKNLKSWNISNAKVTIHLLCCILSQPSFGPSRISLLFLSEATSGIMRYQLYEVLEDFLAIQFGVIAFFLLWPSLAPSNDLQVWRGKKHLIKNKQDWEHSTKGRITLYEIFLYSKNRKVTMSKQVEAERQCVEEAHTNPICQNCHCTLLTVSILRNNASK